MNRTFSCALVVGFVGAGCASTKEPPRPSASPVTEPAPVDIGRPIAETPREPEQQPELTCDPEADEGTRCGENEARYCFQGRCLEQKDCRAACAAHWADISVRCLEDAEKAHCEGGDCSDAYTQEATRCASHVSYGEASCLERSCGDPERARQLLGRD